LDKIDQTITNVSFNTLTTNCMGFPVGPTFSSLNC